MPTGVDPEKKGGGGGWAIASYPGPPFVLLVTFNQCGCAHGNASFTMTSFQSAHGQVAVYSSSETDDRIVYDSSLQLAVIS